MVSVMVADVWSSNAKPPPLALLVPMASLLITRLLVIVRAVIEVITPPATPLPTAPAASVTSQSTIATRSRTRVARLLATVPCWLTPLRP
jgi:hypothetical protein